MPALDPFLGQTVNGVRCERLVGSGGFGRVYQAHHLRLDLPVALKLLRLPPGLGSATALQRFQREAWAAARLHSPRVARVYDTFNVEGAPAIVYEFVQGQDLEARVQEQGPLELKEVLKLGEGLAAALCDLHGAGLVHRDLKPANVMASEDDAVKVIDLGLVRILEESASQEGGSLTRTGSMLGTAFFLAPEQIQAQPGAIGPPADLFGLGGILYYLLTECAPHAEENDPSVMVVLARRLGEHLTPIRELREGVPRWLSELIVRLLARNPAARPSAEEVQAEFAARRSKGAPAKRSRSDSSGRNPALRSARSTGRVRSQQSTRSPKRSPLLPLVGVALAGVALFGLALRGSSSPEPERADVERVPVAEEPEKPTPAKPKTAPAKRKSEPAEPEPKPEPAKPKPEPAKPKPEPKPEPAKPKPESKPEPAKPKPEPELAKPKPEPEPAKPKPEPEPAKPEPAKPEPAKPPAKEPPKAAPPKPLLVVELKQGKLKVGGVAAKADTPIRGGHLKAASRGARLELPGGGSLLLGPRSEFVLSDTLTLLRGEALIDLRFGTASFPIALGKLRGSLTPGARCLLKVQRGARRGRLALFEGSAQLGEHELVGKQEVRLRSGKLAAPKGWRAKEPRWASRLGARSKTLLSLRKDLKGAAKWTGDVETLEGRQVLRLPLVKSRYSAAYARRRWQKKEFFRSGGAVEVEVALQVDQDLQLKVQFFDKTRNDNYRWTIKVKAGGIRRFRARLDTFTAADKSGTPLGDDHSITALGVYAGKSGTTPRVHLVSLVVRRLQK